MVKTCRVMTKRHTVGLTLDLLILQPRPSNLILPKSSLNAKIVYMHTFFIPCSKSNKHVMSNFGLVHLKATKTLFNFNRGLFSVRMTQCLKNQSMICLHSRRTRQIQTWCYFFIFLKSLFIHLEYLCIHPSVFSCIHASICPCSYKLHYSTWPLLTVTVKKWLPIIPTVNTCQRQLTQSSLWHCWISDMKDGLDSPLWQRV